MDAEAGDIDVASRGRTNAIITISYNSYAGRIVGICPGRNTELVIVYFYISAIKSDNNCMLAASGSRGFDGKPVYFDAVGKDKNVRCIGIIPQVIIHQSS